MKESELYDPTMLLREAAHYSSRECPENINIINEKVKERLEEIRKQKINDYEGIKAGLEQRIARSTTERGRTYVRLDWLITQQVISLDQLHEYGFIDPDFNPLQQSLHSRIKSWVTNLLHRYTADPTIERRTTRRLPINGKATLSWRRKPSGQPQSCTVHLCDISTGGVGLLLDKGQTLENIVHAVECEVDIATELLTVKAHVGHRGHENLDNQTRLNMQWVEPTQTPLAKITKYVKAAS